MGLKVAPLIGLLDLPVVYKNSREIFAANSKMTRSDTDSQHGV